MRRFLTTLSLAIAGFVLSTPAQSALATTSAADNRFRLPFIEAPLNGGTISFATLFNSIINVILVIAGFLAIVYLIFSGIRYITSAGNADQAKAARQGIINAVIGIAVVVASFVIVRLVAQATGGAVQTINNGSTSGSVTSGGGVTR